MNKDSIIVKNSKINWKWVFALRDFKKGEIVLYWDISHILPKEIFDKMPDNDKKYISYLDGKYIIMQEPEKYVNHSCEPNTTAKNFCDIAIKNIKKWEEITGNYQETWESYFDCNCGAKDCKNALPFNHSLTIL